MARIMTTALTHYFVAPAADSLAAYIDRVRKIPLLSEAEELSLARRCYHNHDKEAARMLCISNLRLVVSLSYKYDGYGLDRADVIQAGNIGLLKAVGRFNPARGARFATFAVHWIRAEIHDFVIANWRIVKIATTKAQRKLFFNMRKLTQKNTERFDAEAVARELEVKPDEVIEMRARLRNTNAVPLTATDDDDDNAAPEARIADHSEGGGDPAVQMEERAKRALMQQAYESLNERERAIVQGRRLRDPALTLQQLADERGLSVERVRQIEAAAMKKMTAFIRTRWEAA